MSHNYDKYLVGCGFCTPDIYAGTEQKCKGTGRYNTEENLFRNLMNFAK